MSAIQKALTDIKFVVPPQILFEAFKDSSASRFNIPTRSIDEVIKEKVLYPRVLVDCNLVGGSYSIIDLTNLSPMTPAFNQFVFQIPDNLTGGRKIMSALSVSYIPYTASFYANQYLGVGNGNNLTNAAERVFNSHASVAAISTARVELIGHNLILITDKNVISPTYAVRVILENDEHLSNIQPRSWLVFSELCALAIKSYIYNTLAIQMGSAYLQGGQELGIFKEIIDGYSNAEEDYKTKLREVWMGVAVMNDPSQYTKFLKLQISPAL